MGSWLGIVLAGVLNGSFAVPIKTARVWKFNHIWTVHSLLAMAVLPWAMVLYAVPDWAATLAAVPARGWAGLGAWGLAFGVGSLLYGIAVDMLGVALGFAIQLGFSIVLGALLPLVWSGSLRLETLQDLFFFAGLAAMVFGVVLCAQAGGAKSGAAATPTGARFRKGLIIALVGGILAPALNFGIQFGTNLVEPAGAASGFPTRTYLAWAVFLSASAIVQAGVCFARLARQGALGVFCARGAAKDALQVLAMATVWIVSVFLYGRSSFGLGRLGFSYGWPIFVGLIILTSNAWGVALGEWKGASGEVFRRMGAGSAALVVGAFLIAQGSR